MASSEVGEFGEAIISNYPLSFQPMKKQAQIKGVFPCHKPLVSELRLEGLSLSLHKL